MKEGKERLEKERDWNEWLTLEIMEVKKEVEEEERDWWLKIKKITKKCEVKVKEKKRKERKENRNEEYGGK